MSYEVWLVCVCMHACVCVGWVVGWAGGLVGLVGWLGWWVGGLVGWLGWWVGWAGGLVGGWGG